MVDRLESMFIESPHVDILVSQNGNCLSENVEGLVLIKEITAPSSHFSLINEWLLRTHS